MRYSFLLIGFAVFLLSNCKSERSESKEDESFSISVRLSEEPPRLHPLLATTFNETQILYHLFQPLADYDPQTLEFSPILITEIPSREIVPEDQLYPGEAKYELTIRPEAVWSDGNPVVAADYLFTAKAVFVPQIQAQSWLGYLSNILHIELDPEDPKKFYVIAEKEYLLSLEAVTNFQIYPRHIYDKNNLLGSFSYSDLRFADEQELDFTENEDLIAFTSQFESEDFSRSTIVGSGAYQLEDWETGQYLTLVKKKDWWGAQFADSHLFAANPQRIIYKVIPDEAVAITALKDNQVDVIQVASPSRYHEMKQDPQLQDQLHFKTSILPTFYYIGMNNQSPLLDSEEVRKAISKLMDVDRLIEDLMYGTAKRTIGPIHPGKSYYNNDIEPYTFAPEEAVKLLAKAGWEDTDDNGIVDKVIDGKRTEMTLRFCVTQAELGQKTALLHKELAAQAGVEIELVVNPSYSEIAKNHLATGEFELVALASRISPADYDPYQSWHSDNYVTGSNVIGFADAEVDDLIEAVRTEENTAERAKLYQEFQEELYDRHPVIFLFSPSNLIVVNKRFEPVLGGKRPGYFENQFTLAD